MEDLSRAPSRALEEAGHRLLQHFMMSFAISRAACDHWAESTCGDAGCVACAGCRHHGRRRSRSRSAGRTRRRGARSAGTGCAHRHGPFILYGAPTLLWAHTRATRRPSGRIPVRAPCEARTSHPHRHRDPPRHPARFRRDPAGTIAALGGGVSAGPDRARSFDHAHGRAAPSRPRRAARRARCPSRRRDPAPPRRGQRSERRRVATPRSRDDRGSARVATQRRARLPRHAARAARAVAGSQRREHQTGIDSGPRHVGAWRASLRNRPGVSSARVSA